MGAVSSPTDLGALELRSPMRRSTTWADPAAPRADPAALRSISSTTLRVDGESDREGAGGEAEEVDEAEEAEGGEVVEGESILPTSAHDGEVVEVAPTPELSKAPPRPSYLSEAEASLEGESFSSPKLSPKGSPSPSQGRVLPHVLSIPHEGIRERAVDELRGGA